MAMNGAGSSSGTAGPFQFSPPKDFSGKKEDCEELSFKLKAYLCLMDSEYKKERQRIEQQLEHELTDADFTTEDGVVKQGTLKR